MHDLTSSVTHRLRRERFFAMMEDGVAIIPTAPVTIRNNDVENRYRADSDFHFLTGFDEPEAIAVFIKDENSCRFGMFLRPKDPEMAMWLGDRAGPEGAVSDFGADEAWPIDEFDTSIRDFIANRPRLYWAFGHQPVLDQRIGAVLEGLRADARKGIHAPDAIIDPRSILWTLRLIKDSSDVERQRRACVVTGEGVRAAMAAVLPDMNESELQAVVEFEFARRGSTRLGFDTICASGNHAATLHYTANNGNIGAGDMVLIDAGAEIAMISGDISRTFPADGRFTEPGKTVYEIVLRAQKAALDTAKPGNTYADVHDAALQVLCEGLIELGAVHGTVDEVISNETYRPYFMHRIGHWLGLDVHDVGPYYVEGQSIRLEPGMIMTIEPGLYFSRDNEATPAKLRGIGVRIEDDILITANGNEILTTDTPKEIDEIERFMAEPGRWWKEVSPLR